MRVACRARHLGLLSLVHSRAYLLDATARLAREWARRARREAECTVQGASSHRPAAGWGLGGLSQGLSQASWSGSGQLGGLSLELGGLSLELGGLSLELGGLSLELGGLSLVLGGLSLELMLHLDGPAALACRRVDTLGFWQIIPRGRAARRGAHAAARGVGCKLALCFLRTSIAR